MSAAKPPIDPDADPYWAGVAAGELRYRRCKSCGAAIFFPRSICPKCGAPDPVWAVSSGTGIVYAFTTVHRAPHAFADRVPYTIVLVDLEEGFRMMGGVIANGRGDDDISVGDRVIVTFKDGPEGRPVPYFEPA